MHILFPKIRLSNRLDTKDLSKDIKIIDKYKNDSPWRALLRSSAPGYTEKQLDFLETIT